MNFQKMNHWDGQLSLGDGEDTDTIIFAVMKNRAVGLVDCVLVHIIFFCGSREAVGDTTCSCSVNIIV